MTIRRWNDRNARSVRAHKQRLYDNQGGKCYMCDRVIDVVDGDVEHDIPRSIPGAGRNELVNLRFVCRACNSLKRSKTLLGFALDTPHPPDHISRDRLAWIIRHHRNPGYPPDLVERANAVCSGVAV